MEIKVTMGATCSDGTAVPNPASNRGLVRDCEALLAARDALKGTGTLNWSARTAIRNWDGVTLTGSRVAELDLNGRSLTGVIALLAVLKCHFLPAPTGFAGPDRFATATVRHASSSGMT